MTPGRPKQTVPVGSYECRDKRTGETGTRTTSIPEHAAKHDNLSRFLTFAETDRFATSGETGDWIGASRPAGARLTTPPRLLSVS